MKKTNVLGIDLGGTKAAIGIISPNGKVLKKRIIKIDVQKGEKHLFNELIANGKELISKYKVSAVGIASAGPINLKKGTLENPTNFPGWKTVHIVKNLKKGFNLPVGFDNDAAGAALAELWIGAGKKVKSLVCVTLGTGVGTGLIIDKKIFRGGCGFAGEGGHLIIEKNNRLCGCGNFGCIETVVSGNAFGKTMEEFTNIKCSGSQAVELVKSKNPKALKAIKAYQQSFAITLHNYAVAYNPELIVISGGFSNAHSLFLNESVKILKTMMKRKMFLMPKIALAKCKDEAGLIGAGYIAFREIGVL